VDTLGGVLVKKKDPVGRWLHCEELLDVVDKERGYASSG
jgi:hypothetical protein